MMKKLVKILKVTGISILSLLLIIILFLFLSIPYGRNSEKPVELSGETKPRFVLRGVNLLTMSDSLVIKNQNLYVNNGIIEHFESDTMPIKSGYEPINMPGRYVMPGLIDMHAHIFDRTDLTQYLSYGVTTVRNMMGFPMHLRWKEQLREGDIAGSRLITASPTMNSGGDGGPFHQNISSAEEAYDAAMSHVKSGYDFIKVYDGITSEQLAGIERAATSGGVDIAGHPPAITLSDLLASDLLTIEHVEELLQFLDEDRSQASMNKLADDLAQANKAVVISLSAYNRIYQTVLDGEAYYNSLLEKPINPLTNFIGKKQLGDYNNAGPKYKAYTLKKYQAMLDLTLTLQNHGVKALFGTDVGPNMTVPGQTVLDEFQLLSEAGLKPYQMLRSATALPGQILKIKAGVIRPTYRAELMVLDSNPMIDLKALDGLQMLIVNDRVYDQAALTELREQGEDKQSLYATLGLFLELLKVTKF